MGEMQGIGVIRRRTCCSAGLASGARVRLRPAAPLLSAGGTGRGSRGNRWRAAPELAPCFPEAPPAGSSQEDRSDTGAHRPLLLASNLCGPPTSQRRMLLLLYALRNLEYAHLLHAVRSPLLHQRTECSKMLEQALALVGAKKHDKDCLGVTVSLFWILEHIMMSVVWGLLGVQGAGVVGVGGPLQALLQRVVRAQQQPLPQPLRRCALCLLLHRSLRLLPVAWHSYSHENICCLCSVHAIQLPWRAQSETPACCTIALPSLLTCYHYEVGADSRVVHGVPLHPDHFLQDRSHVSLV